MGKIIYNILESQMNFNFFNIIVRKLYVNSQIKSTIEHNKQQDVR